MVCSFAYGNTVIWIWKEKTFFLLCVCDVFDWKEEANHFGGILCVDLNHMISPLSTLADIVTNRRYQVDNVI